MRGCAFFSLALMLAGCESDSDPLDAIEAQAPSVELGEVHDQIVEGDAPYGDGQVDDAIPGDSVDNTAEQTSAMIELLRTHCMSAHDADARFWSQTAFVYEVICAGEGGVWYDNYDGSMGVWGDSRQIAQSWIEPGVAIGLLSVPQAISRGCGLDEFDSVLDPRWGARMNSGHSPPNSLDFVQEIRSGFPLCYNAEQGVVWVNLQAGVDSSIASSAPANPRFVDMQRVVH